MPCVKKCKQCGETKLLTQFRRHKHTKDKRISRCNTCDTAYQRAYKAQPHRKSYAARAYTKYAESLKGRAVLVYGGAKRRAKKYGLSFALTLRWVERKFEKGQCEMTGLPLDLRYGEGYRVNLLSPSLDRIDNGKGYTKKNTRLVCSWFNLAKNQFSDADVMLCASALVNYQSKLKAQRSGKVKN